MDDDFVTVLEYCHWEDSEPIGVFESHAKAIEYLVATYGPVDNATHIEEDCEEVCVDAGEYPNRIQFCLYRIEMNTARRVIR